MRRNGLSLRTHRTLLKPYLREMVPLIWPALLVQAVVIVALILVLFARMRLAGKIPVFLCVLLFGEALAHVLWEGSKEKRLRYSTFRQRVARETTDAHLIEELCLNDRNEDVRMEAVGAILDENRLFDRALHDGSNRVRVLAASRVRSPETATALLLASGDADVRITVLPKIREEALLREYALQDPDIGVRFTSARNIESPEMVPSVLGETRDEGVWRCCLPKLVRAGKTDGALSDTIWAVIRTAKHADQFLRLWVCPDCYGTVVHDREEKPFDPSDYNAYDDDDEKPLIDYWEIYTCDCCGRQELDNDFSERLDSLLA